jgi:hypothetical protein
MKAQRAVYRSRSISRDRRTAAQMDDIRHAIIAVLEGYNPMTVRQAFYQLVSRGDIAKSEAEYKTVVRLLTDMRRRRQISFGWIADNTRWMRKPRTFDSMEDMLQYSQQTYRRSIWNDQKDYVEIWLEKDALAGVLYNETQSWDVPLMVTRGYSSVTFLHSAAEAIAEQGKPAFIYYLGDWDPSGRDITRAVEEGLHEFAPEADIDFTRIAVTEEQIGFWKLPTRPTKATDSRSKNFEGESVEVDAIDPKSLRELVSKAIESHIDRNAWWRTTMLEIRERETISRLVEGFKNGGEAP